MKRNIAWMLLTLSVLAMLVGTRVYAQSSAVLRVDIPFDFRVGNQSMSSGEYTVTPFGQTLVVIQSKDRKQSAAATTNAVDANSSLTEGTLIFNRYGSYHFLSQIWTPANAVGRKLSRSKAEQEVANLASQSDTTVLIAEKVKK